MNLGTAETGSNEAFGDTLESSSRTPFTDRGFLHIEHADAPMQEAPTMSRKPISELPQGKLVGASLLCYCVDPTWSRVYFLLGKERKNLRWRAGSEKWSGFGGRTSSKTATAEETAAKEFVEETLAMVKFFDHDTLPRTTHVDIANALRQQDYTFQLVFSFGQGEGARNYVTFVRQIPWDPQALNRFAEVRDMLLNPVQHYGSTMWSQLVEPNPGIKQTRVAARDDNAAVSRHDVNDPDMLNDDETDEIVTQVPTSAEHGTPPMNVNIQVNKDYLEKKMLGLWSIPQLQHAVESNGIMSRREGRVERCRPGFASTAELVLSELAFHQPEVMQESTYGGTGLL